MLFPSNYSLVNESFKIMTLFVFLQQRFLAICFLITVVGIHICHAFTSASSCNDCRQTTLFQKLPRVDCQFRVKAAHVNYHGIHRSPIQTWVMASSTNEQSPDIIISTGTTSYEMVPNEKTPDLYQPESRLFLPWRKKRRQVVYSPSSKLSFEYHYNELVIPSPTESSSTRKNRNKIVVLIHPIGVGIGRWYYDRLLKEIQEMKMTSLDENRTYEHFDCNMTFLVPDLLACGSASNPELYNDKRVGNSTFKLNQIPLLETHDWSNQILDLMIKQESIIMDDDNDDDDDDGPTIEWYIVSNGGCIPIALDVAHRQILHTEKSGNHHPLLRGKVTNLILSAPPQISSLIKARDDALIQKSYKTLTGIAGKIFWWYALRNNGAFIQKFSEKNLASNPDNLGSEWTPKCVETAGANQGRSRYSTFAFLAGSLNGGNLEVLNSLKTDTQLKIDIIAGGDTRRNQARSWFWNRSKNSRVGSDRVVSKQESISNSHSNSNTTEYDALQPGSITTTKTTLFQYLQENGFNAKEVTVGGRRCPAHEDARGFAQALLDILHNNSV